MNLKASSKLLLSMAIAGVCTAVFPASALPIANAPQGLATKTTPLATNPAQRSAPLMAQPVAIEVPAIGAQFGAKTMLQAVVVGKQDSQGVSNANVSFSIDGKVVGNANSGPGGVTRLDYKVDLNPGDHTIQAQFTPSAGMPYLGGMSNGTLIVSTAETKIVLVNDFNAIRGLVRTGPDGSAATGQLIRLSDGAPIPGVKVNVHWADLSFGSATTGPDGVFFQPIVTPDTFFPSQAAMSRVDFQFSGNKQYKPAEWKSY